MNTNYFNQESARLRYRALTRDDIPAWATFFENNDSLHFFNLEKNYNGMEQSQIWIERQLNRYDEFGLGLLAATEKESENLVGIVGLIPRTFEKGDEIEIGYSFLPSCWGNGYATEAAITMKEFARDNRIAPRVVSMINPDNLPSINVAKRNGMKPLFETVFEGEKHIVFGTESF
ncbi:MAG: GNAT family N-acetyltransferase [Fluviicola sp.]